LLPTAADVSENDFPENSSFNPLIEYIVNSKEENSDDQIFVRGSILKSGRLDLCFQSVDLNVLGQIFEAIRLSGMIKHILLGNNLIGDSGAKMVADFIKTGTCIRTWYICACNFTSHGIGLICDAINSFDTLVTNPGDANGYT